MAGAGEAGRLIYRAAPRLQAGFPWLQLESTGSFKHVLIKDHHSRPTNNTSDGRSWASVHCQCSPCDSNMQARVENPLGQVKVFGFHPN